LELHSVPTQIIIIIHFTTLESGDNNNSKCSRDNVSLCTRKKNKQIYERIKLNACSVRIMTSENKINLTPLELEVGRTNYVIKRSPRIA
jgi:hypothetical protein